MASRRNGVETQDVGLTLCDRDVHAGVLLMYMLCEYRTALQPFGFLDVSQSDRSGMVVAGGGVVVAFSVLVLCSAWLVVRFS